MSRLEHCASIVVSRLCLNVDCLVPAYTGYITTVLRVLASNPIDTPVQPSSQRNMPPPQKKDYLFQRMSCLMSLSNTNMICKHCGKPIRSFSESSVLWFHEDLAAADGYGMIACINDEKTIVYASPVPAGCFFPIEECPL